MSSTLIAGSLHNPRLEAAVCIARSICSSQGPSGGCWCKGEKMHCHAPTLYSDFAISALLGLERAGYVVVKKQEEEAAA